MKALILGDIHGEWKIANKIIRRAKKRHPDVTHILQVGDLADHWPKKKRGEFTRWNPETDLPVHWCEGNHDDYNMLEQHGSTLNPKLIYQPRGSVLEIDGFRLMFFGGATSIDKDYRLALMREGSPKIWWEQESITHAQFFAAMEQEGPFDAIFSHERPESFDVGVSKLPTDIGKSDRAALDALWRHFLPPFWFFGHYHFAKHGIFKGTEWTLCPMMGTDSQVRYTIWDGHSVERLP